MGVECPTCGQECANEAGMKRHHSWMHDESIARVTRACANCGDERELYESKAEALATDYCQSCIEGGGLGDKHPNAGERPPEVGQKISESKRGMEVPEHVLKAAHKGWREWWEQKDDKDAFVDRMHSAIPEKVPQDQREQISKTLEGHEVSEETRQKIRESLTPSGPLSIDVPETGHTVKSYWEREIDLLLHGESVAYEYESETFQLDGRAYTPDFIVGEVVIEVKGYARDTDIERAEMFVSEYPGLEYVAIGAELPCDVHLPWEERHRLPEVL